MIIDPEDSISELQLLRKAGGQTVVDVSSIGIRRNVKDLPKIARESGVNIITGTGYYVDLIVPEDAKMMTVQEVYILVFHAIWEFTQSEEYIMQSEDHQIRSQSVLCYVICK